MSDNTNRPDPKSVRCFPMTVEERQDYEALQRLEARFGRNIPTPVDLYGEPGGTCFVVVNGQLCALRLICEDDGLGVELTERMAAALRTSDIEDVCDRWAIKAQL
jgi:hypothetical protein